MRCTGCGSCVPVCPRTAITHDGEQVEETTGVLIHREKCIRCFACAAVCPSRALRKCGAEYPAEELVATIKPDIPFFKNSGGGVTVTGGEPLVQSGFTFEVLDRCRESGIHTLLETSGQGSWEELEKIAGVCSMIYFDIKLLDSGQHRKWTGVPNTVIHENLRNLCRRDDMAGKITVRVPCIPDVNDSIQNIRDIADFTANLNIQNIQLLPYNSMAGEKYRWIGKSYSMENTSARDKVYYEELNKVIKSTGLTIVNG